VRIRSRRKGDWAITTIREDIQGLRAIAVLPVLLFHFDIDLLPGGFVGVDIFFVISGYVITLGLIRGLCSGQFSLRGFYVRRIRRLAPALLATCALTSLAAWCVLLPPDLAAFGRSMIAVLLSVSNMYFWQMSGYFAPESQSQPLLHCWSLAVEEQFYLIMPGAMLLTWRYLGGRWLWLIVPVGVTSLAICLACAFVAASAGFYLLPPRAWELMLGAGLATYAHDHGRMAHGMVLRQALSWLGFGFIASTMLTLHDRDPFPAWNALMPCLGTALLIWSGSGAGPLPMVNRALSIGPARFVGRISYSLYLVHWPIAALFRYRLLRGPDPIEAVLMLALSLILAWLMWWLVEKPGRLPAGSGATGGTTMRKRMGRLALVAGGFVALTGLGAVMAVAGVPARFPDFVAAHTSAQAEWGGPQCFNEKLSRPIPWDERRCTRTHGPRHRILVWGDSFAAHYIPGLMRNAAARDADVLQYTFAGCPPVLAFGSLSRIGCSISNARVPAMLDRLHIDTVVLAARWTDTPHHTLLQLHGTIAALKAHGARVYLIGQSPEFSADVQRIDYLSGQHRAPVGQWRISFDPAINRLLARESAHATFIDPLAALCHGDLCPYRQGDTWLYGDYGHFSASGSLLAANKYFPVD
jgi:peptidoglycan/LPS O-acetylase OafA/YrhL